MVRIDEYPSLAHYCAGPEYQKWLTEWQPPSEAKVDVWQDDEGSIRRYFGHPEHNTPRQYGLTRYATRLAFYHLDTLQINDLPCVDIGCGYNWFKRFYPSIWGVDPDNDSYRDEKLTQEWYRYNWGKWPRLFSFNAIHFDKQQNIARNIALARGLLSSGGRALIGMNQARIKDHSPNYDPAQLKQTLQQTPGLQRMVWIHKPRDAAMDGNLWLWLDKS